MKRRLPQIALWLVHWLPLLYVGVFAYSTHYTRVDPGSPRETEIREFGWPFHYFTLEKDLLSASGNSSFDTRFTDRFNFAVDIVVSIIFAALLAFLTWAWLTRFRRNGFRFRLTTLLAIFVVVSLPLGAWRYLDNGYQREQSIIAELKTLDVGIATDDEPLILRRMERILPRRSRIVWRRAKYAWFEYPDKDHDLRRTGELLAQLSHLHNLDYSELFQVDKPLQIVPMLPALSEINLGSATVTDEGLDKLKNCNWLRKIEIYSNDVSAEQLRELRDALPNTKVISEYEDDFQ